MQLYRREEKNTNEKRYIGEGGEYEEKNRTMVDEKNFRREICNNSDFHRAYSDYSGFNA